MKMQRLAAALAAVNLVLLVLMLSPWRPVFLRPAVDAVAPVLRARALEIVDDRGRTRAQIVVAPAGRLEGVAYPETVLFRLIDPEGQPTVKMGASIEGSGLSMLGGPDTAGWYGLQIIANAEKSVIKLVSKAGPQTLIQP